MTDLKFDMKSRGTIDYFLLKFIYSTQYINNWIFKIDIMRHIRSHLHFQSCAKK